MSSGSDTPETPAPIGPDGWADFPCASGRLAVYVPRDATLVFEHDYREYVKAAATATNPSPAA